MSVDASIKDWIGYTETQDQLAIRIEANKKFTNLRIEDWILKKVAIKSGQKVLDIGCGNGNLFPTYDQLLTGTGVIVGMDQSKELLMHANQLPLSTPLVLIERNMNESLPFMDAAFDWVISSFAIYYVDSSKQMLQEIARVLRPGGQLLLMGPCQENARELYAFDEKLFGIKKHDKANVRTRRLEEEFYPGMKGIFKDITKEILAIKIAFPNREEFVKYYLATLLFEESSKATGRMPHADDLKAVNMNSFDVSKEVVVIRGVMPS